MKVLVGAFNQEKALVGAFSVIVQPVVEPMDHFTALVCCLGEAQIIHCGLISVKKLVIGLIGVDPGNMDLWSGRAEAVNTELSSKLCFHNIHSIFRYFLVKSMLKVLSQLGIY